MSRLDPKTLIVDEWHPFVNEKYEGISIEWVANTGFGQCRLYRLRGSTQWKADTEFTGKGFLKLLFEKIVDEAEAEDEDHV